MCIFFGNCLLTKFTARWPAVTAWPANLCRGLQWTASWPAMEGPLAAHYRVHSLSHHRFCCCCHHGHHQLGSGPSPGASLGLCRITNCPGHVPVHQEPGPTTQHAAACSTHGLHPVCVYVHSCQTHVLCSHACSIVPLDFTSKHKFKDKIMNFMVVIAEH